MIKQIYEAELQCTLVANLSATQQDCQPVAGLQASYKYKQFEVLLTFLPAILVAPYVPSSESHFAEYPDPKPPLPKRINIGTAAVAI